MKTSTLVCKYALENRALREQVASLQESQARTQEGVQDLLTIIRRLSEEIRALVEVNHNLGTTLAAERLKVQRLVAQFTSNKKENN